MKNRRNFAAAVNPPNQPLKSHRRRAVPAPLGIARVCPLSRAALGIATIAILSAAVPGPATRAQEQASAEEASVELAQIPTPDLTSVDPMIEEAVGLRTRAVRDAFESGEGLAVMEAYGELAYLFHAHELWKQALVAYDNAARLAPGDPRWPYASGLALHRSGDLEGAAAAYEASLDIAPDNPAALVSLAEIRLEQNQPEWAKALLRHAMKVLPESPAVLSVLGQVALSQERWGRAADYFERALSQQPQATRLHYPLGLAYRGLGDLDKARENIAKRGEVGVRPPDHVRDSIEQRKTGERVMLLEGRRAFAAGRFAEAISLFEKASLADPTSVRARVNMASAIAMNGDPDQALEIYRELLETVPDNSAVLFNAGTLLRQSGEMAEALPLLEKAAALAPEDGEVRLELARALVQLERLDEALENADAAALNLPGNYEATLLASDLHAARGSWSSAYELLARAHRAMPENGPVAHSLARLLAASGDGDVRNAELAVNLASRVAAAAATPLHLETLALALGEAGRCEQAAEAQRKAVSAAAEQPALQERLREAVGRYTDGPPCRPPLGAGQGNSGR
ncbi:MAG: tetratricopeptide repeat protein [Acidobacteriota bacterium]